MPNWVTNNVTIRGKDQSDLQAMVDIIGLDKSNGDDGVPVGLFQYLIPCPEELYRTPKQHFPDVPEFQDQIKMQNKLEIANIQKYKFPTWLEHNHEMWGTKWDACRPEVLSLTEGELVLLFDTAWAAPIPIFEHLTAKGFEVEAVYYEEGMQSWGRYQNGEVEYSTPPDWDRYGEVGPIAFYGECVPQYITDAFPYLKSDLEDEQQYWENEREEATV